MAVVKLCGKNYLAKCKLNNRWWTWGSLMPITVCRYTAKSVLCFLLFNFAGKHIKQEFWCLLSEDSLLWVWWPWSICSVARMIGGIVLGIYISLPSLLFFLLFICYIGIEFRVFYLIQELYLLNTGSYWQHQKVLFNHTI